MSGFRTLEINNRGTTLLTESGYIMIVKSFTDYKAGEVTYVKYFLKGVLFNGNI